MIALVKHPILFIINRYLGYYNSVGIQREKLRPKMLYYRQNYKVECHNIEKEIFRCHDTTVRLVTGSYELCDIQEVS